MRIGGIIKKLRLQQKITQSQLAQVLNVERTTISNYENNYSNPDIETVVKLADYFNVSTDYLLSRIETSDKNVEWTKESIKYEM